MFHDAFAIVLKLFSCEIVPIDVPSKLPCFDRKMKIKCRPVSVVSYSSLVGSLCPLLPCFDIWCVRENVIKIQIQNLLLSVSYMDHRSS